MKFFSKYFPNRSLLLVIAISTSLLAAACNGSPGPAPSAETTAPGVASEFSDSPENSPDSAANSPSKAEATATRNEETPTTTAATSTPNPTVTSESYPTRKPASTYADLEIITLLPPDAIPSIDNPQFLTAEEADDFYDPQELVMGVSFNGDSRAYSAPFLSNHEIVNDTVGGEKIAVTW